MILAIANAMDIHHQNNMKKFATATKTPIIGYDAAIIGVSEVSGWCGAEPATGCEQ
ncbi:hypothetical protein ACNKHO_12215 [Shigella flexneri]